MVKIKINDQECEVEEGLTLLQACEKQNLEIPRFCYHEKLSIAGNCRMCLVELERAPKLVASCATIVADGMVVHTNSDKVKNAQKAVMELLLINHPLDCPICDQGGECDLQDQAYAYGIGENKFSEFKRSVHDKNMGPLIKTYMTRCIHCTRCIRFADEIAGIEEMGAVGRGEHMEITSYLHRAVQSEMSGNMIDICPVGALTSKPFAFKARNWEMKHTDSIDPLDAVGSNIRVDSRGAEVLRILPRTNEEINEEWISDKTRFAYDGLKNQRIDRPYIRSNGRMQDASWDEALNVIAQKLQHANPQKIAGIAGTLTDLESLYALKLLINHLGSYQTDFNQFGLYFDAKSRGNYLFNTSVASIEKSDFCLLIGAHPRQNATILNARIRKSVVNHGMKVARLGEADNQTYPIEELGNELKILQDILSGKHKISKDLKNSKNPMIIIGDSALSHSEAEIIYQTSFEIANKYNIIRDDWNGFNVLHNHAVNVGALDLGFYAAKQAMNAQEMARLASEGQLDVLFLLGADEVEVKQSDEAFVIYFGHHGDRNAANADVVLPAPAYTEKNAIYINLEGRAQLTHQAVSPPGESKAEYQAILDLCEIMNIDLGFKNLEDIRQKLSEGIVAVANLDKLSSNEVSLRNYDAEPKTPKLSGQLKKLEQNYYMTDAISRHSVTMAKCTKARQELENIDQGHEVV